MAKKVTRKKTAKKRTVRRVVHRTNVSEVQRHLTQLCHDAVDFMGNSALRQHQMQTHLGEIASSLRVLAEHATHLATKERVQRLLAATNAVVAEAAPVAKSGPIEWDPTPETHPPATPQQQRYVTFDLPEVRDWLLEGEHVKMHGLRGRIIRSNPNDKSYVDVWSEEQQFWPQFCRFSELRDYVRGPFERVTLPPVELNRALAAGECVSYPGGEIYRVKEGVLQYWRDGENGFVKSDYDKQRDLFFAPLNRPWGRVADPSTPKARVMSVNEAFLQGRQLQVIATCDTYVLTPDGIHRVFPSGDLQPSVFKNAVELFTQYPAHWGVWALKPEAPTAKPQGG